MSVSIICACKNRNAPLKISLSSWLSFSQISEIIIVDWSSDESLNDLANLDSRIKIISVPNQKYFNQPEPLNLALSLTTGDYILKLDSDHVINPYLNFFEKYNIDKNSFVSGQPSVKNYEFYNQETGTYVIDHTRMSFEDLRDYFRCSFSYYKHLYGLLFIAKENLIEIGGYNENLGEYYAVEDDEIYQRLEIFGLNHIKIKYDDSFFHIPHPDKKRIENFKAYHTDNELNSEIYASVQSQGYCGDELEWQAGYALTQAHIKKNKQHHLKEDENYYFQSKIKWDVTQINDQLYIAEKLYTNKLQEFPTVYYISLEESVGRQKNITKQFSQYGITPIPIISKRFKDSDDIVTGKYINQLLPGTIGCAVSHLKAIKEWYNTTNEDYAFFCEDDLSLETVQYWNFTWTQFINSLPNDWECVQLLYLKNDGNVSSLDLKEREWDDWAVTAYIITRDYAKKIIDSYCIEDTYNLELKNSEVMPLVETLFYSLGKSYSIPLFVEDCTLNSTFTENKEHDQDLHGSTHRRSYDKIIQLWKDKKMTPNKKIVDYFPFFAPTGKEMLELRVAILNDYVDEFIICESNRTQSGVPIEYELENIIDELKLPKDKIRIIKLNIPDDENLEVQEIDHHNCYDGNSSNINSLRARARERMQKDALLSVLDDYSDDTVFIHSDSDEIVKPDCIDYISSVVRSDLEVVIRIPIVHLEGRADLRVYMEDTNQPKEWTGMFFATKIHLQKATPTQIRSNVFNPLPINFLTENGQILQDLGWHFSWMGSSDIRKAKCKAFTHYDDEFDYLVTSKYKNDDTAIFQNNLIVAENQTPPSGIKNTILKKYQIENLPKEVFKSEAIKNFLLPEVKTTSDTFKIEYENACNTPSDINENLPILFEFANKCNHVTEMGVRYGTSTRAFLNTDVILRSYDVFIDEEVLDLFKIAKTYGKNVEYIKSDVREIEIEETDLLFIDTWHCYDQLKTELKLHHNKVKKYIIFHDTHTFGVKGEESEIGLLPAIIEFLIEFPEWKFILHKVNNNGLTIIEKNNNQNLHKDIKIKTEIEKLLTNYALDPENPESNFLLGLWYEREGHNAPALSYFLRSAERSDNINFQYLSLIKCYFCYERQGTRDNTAKSILLQAISILPRRPEAYYLACKFHEKRNQWSDCYAYACQALEVCEFNLEELECDVEYPGKYGLFFGKAISAYWWGKGDEARETFNYILDNYDLPHKDKNLIHDNIIRIGGEIKDNIL
jgi:hypothetical protein